MEVPSTRFNKFNAPWVKKKLGEILKIGSGKDYKHLNNGNIPVYGSGGYMLSVDEHIHEGVSVCIGRKGSISNPMLLKGKFWAVDTLFYTFDYQGVLPDYLYHIFTRIPWIKHNEATGVPSLSKKIIEHIQVDIPTNKAEQQKIADFLTAVDQKLQLLEEKHALISQYKKGVMQKLFKQEIRFKDDDGSDFPDWEIALLKTLATKSTNKNKDGSLSLVLTNSAKDGIVSQSEYFNKDIANQDNLKGYSVVEINDFVYNPRISELAPVGPINRNSIGKGVMSPLYTVFSITNKNNLDYIEYYFKTTMWHKYMFSIANFGARHDRMNITTSDFFELPIPLPPVKEQNKIAEFLQTLDKKLDAVNQQITLTQTFKKGLLQQMFV